MKKTERVKLSFWDSFTHYFIVLFLFLPLIFSLIDLVKFSLNGFSGVRTPQELFLVNLPFAFIGILFYYIQYNRLKFKVLTIDLPNDIIQNLIKNTAQELEWRPEINTKYFKTYKTYPKLITGSWGEKITIIIDNDRIMINSICDPEKRASVVSVGRNRKNMKVLIDKLNIASR